MYEKTYETLSEMFSADRKAFARERDAVIDSFLQNHRDSNGDDRSLRELQARIDFLPAEPGSPEHMHQLMQLLEKQLEQTAILAGDLPNLMQRLEHTVDKLKTQLKLADEEPVS